MRPILVIVLAAVTTAAFAAPPNLKTPNPVIYLADNLDEADGLGFCLDTMGRGLSDRLHVHSCKPQGGDVQFRFDEAGRIISVAFPDLCAEITSTDPKTVEFQLNTCSDAPLQRFTYDDASGEIRVGEDQALCLAAGNISKSAGPFQSRDLMLGDCTSTNGKLKTWVVLE